MAAQQGDALAQLNLGLMYEGGQGVAQDYQEAVRWYRSAAEQGVGAAQENLGWMYGKGQGVAQDYVLSHMWFNLAADNIDSEEQEQELVILRNSIAAFMTSKQIAEAKTLAKKCTEHKFKGCQRK
jgi:TPR repeat protein